jgi:hypothetical protein
MVTSCYHCVKEQLPDGVEWYADRFVSFKTIVELSKAVGFAVWPVKIGVLSTLWKNHLPGATIVAQFNRFIVVDESHDKAQPLCDTKKPRKTKGADQIY